MSSGIGGPPSSFHGLSGVGGSSPLEGFPPYSDNSFATALNDYMQKHCIPPGTSAWQVYNYTFLQKCLSYAAEPTCPLSSEVEELIEDALSSTDMSSLQKSPVSALFTQSSLTGSFTLSDLHFIAQIIYPSGIIQDVSGLPSIQDWKNVDAVYTAYTRLSPSVQEPLLNAVFPASMLSSQFFPSGGNNILAIMHASGFDVDKVGSTSDFATLLQLIQPSGLLDSWLGSVFAHALTVESITDVQDLISACFQCGVSCDDMISVLDTTYENPQGPESQERLATILTFIGADYGTQALFSSLSKLPANSEEGRVNFLTDCLLAFKANGCSDTQFIDLLRLYETLCPGFRVPNNTPLEQALNGLISLLENHPAYDSATLNTIIDLIYSGSDDELNVLTQLLSVQAAVPSVFSLSDCDELLELLSSSELAQNQLAANIIHLAVKWVGTPSSYAVLSQLVGIASQGSSVILLTFITITNTLLDPHSNSDLDASIVSLFAQWGSGVLQNTNELSILTSLATVADSGSNAAVQAALTLANIASQPQNMNVYGDVWAKISEGLVQQGDVAAQLASSLLTFFQPVLPNLDPNQALILRNFSQIIAQGSSGCLNAANSLIGQAVANPWVAQNEELLLQLTQALQTWTGTSTPSAAASLAAQVVQLMGLWPQTFTANQENIVNNLSAILQASSSEAIQEASELLTVYFVPSFGPSESVLFGISSALADPHADNAINQESISLLVKWANASLRETSSQQTILLSLSEIAVGGSSQAQSDALRLFSLLQNPALSPAYDAVFAAIASSLTQAPTATFFLLSDKLITLFTTWDIPQGDQSSILASLGSILETGSSAAIASANTLLGEAESNSTLFGRTDFLKALSVALANPGVPSQYQLATQLIALMEPWGASFSSNQWNVLNNFLTIENSSSQDALNEANQLVGQLLKGTSVPDDVLLAVTSAIANMSSQVAIDQDLVALITEWGAGNETQDEQSILENLAKISDSGSLFARLPISDLQALMQNPSLSPAYNNVFAAIAAALATSTASDPSPTPQCILAAGLIDLFTSWGASISQDQGSILSNLAKIISSGSLAAVGYANTLLIQLLANPSPPPTSYDNLEVLTAQIATSTVQNPGPTSSCQLMENLITLMGGWSVPLTQDRQTLVTNFVTLVQSGSSSAIDAVNQLIAMWGGSIGTSEEAILLNLSQIDVSGSAAAQSEATQLLTLLMSPNLSPAYDGIFATLAAALANTQDPTQFALASALITQFIAWKPPSSEAAKILTNLATVIASGSQSAITFATTLLVLIQNDPLLESNLNFIQVLSAALATSTGSDPGPSPQCRLAEDLITLVESWPSSFSPGEEEVFVQLAFIVGSGAAATCEVADSLVASLSSPQGAALLDPSNVEIVEQILTGLLQFPQGNPSYMLATDLTALISALIKANVALPFALLKGLADAIPDEASSADSVTQLLNQLLLESPQGSFAKGFIVSLNSLSPPSSFSDMCAEALAANLSNLQPTDLAAYINTVASQVAPNDPTSIIQLFSGVKPPFTPFSALVSQLSAVVDADPSQSAALKSAFAGLGITLS